MIHHISIPAENPLRVAKALAEIWNGKVAPFPAHRDSYMMLAMDEYGTLIEVYPQGTELIPGIYKQQVEYSYNAFNSGFTATHAAVSVPASQEKIEEIADREGWRVLRCSRDSLFEVIELWIENRTLIELLTPAIASQYLQFMQPQNLEQFFAAAPSLA